MSDKVMLFDLLANRTYPKDVKFLTQDADGVINMYDSYPGGESVWSYWTCRGFLGYVQEDYESEEDLVLPLAEDFQSAIMVVENGLVVGRVFNGSHDYLFETSVEVFESTDSSQQLVSLGIPISDTENGVEAIDIALEMVNQYLKENDVDIKFDLTVIGE